MVTRLLLSALRKAMDYRFDGQPQLYYLDETGAMITGDVNIEGQAHSFDASGAKADQTAVDEPEIEDTEISGTTVITE